ncbi:MAG TPA: sigma-54 dependent transcriptional regulator [Rhodanobacteraceae bacterium]|nr:sigma-54 dependent transcriptional regulator [Rhodanobacteraceae bacterium]
MSKLFALVVDDERDIRELLTLTLGRMGLVVESAATVAEARERLAGRNYALCFTDMRLPDGSGQEIIELIAGQYPLTPVAMITAYGNVDAAVVALKAGAFDFVSKPVDLGVLRRLVQTALKLSEEKRSDQTASSAKLIGNSAPMQALRATIAKVARSQAPVYIVGESGVGKELVARLIHEQGPRSAAAFVPVNCGAIPSELMESEFFGHKKGSFTGAHADKDGLFQAANGGTLFLDEVAELPLPMQVKLLRVIQEKAVRTIGAHGEVAVDVRILSATHKNLARLVELGAFRQDLFYRINVIELRVPPLRERREDIAELAGRVLDRLAKDSGSAPAILTPEALDALLVHPFQGNVRELENVLERAVAMCEGNTIGADDLQLAPRGSNAARDPSAIAQKPPDGRAGGGATAPQADDDWTRRAGNARGTLSPAPAPGRSEQTVHAESNAAASDALASARTAIDDASPTHLADAVAETERAAIMKALESTRWNRTAAAKLLGLTLRQLRYRLERLGIE